MQALGLQGIKWHFAKPFMAHLSTVWPFGRAIGHKICTLDSEEEGKKCLQLN